MSRYIDEEYVLVEAENIFSDMGDYGWLKRIFENPSAPSIDIVRCKECKYCVNGQCWKTDGLDKLDGNVSDDDFCSRGEREGE